MYNVTQHHTPFGHLREDVGCKLPVTLGSGSLISWMNMGEGSAVAEHITLAITMNRDAMVGMYIRCER